MPAGAAGVRNPTSTSWEFPVPVTWSISRAKLAVATGPTVTSLIPLFSGPPDSSVLKRASLISVACTSVVRKITFLTLCWRYRRRLARSAAKPSQRSYGRM
jgi:hypothetical protein